MLVDRPGHKIVWLSLRHPSAAGAGLHGLRDPQSSVQEMGTHCESGAPTPAHFPCPSPTRHAGSTVRWERMWCKSAIPGSGSGGS